MTTQHPDTPETGITPGGTSGAFRDVLSKDHARRGKPPLHFVDMTPEQRIEKAAELGLPKFRVKQLANHYFGHFDVNAAEFTDFPAAKRSEAAAAFFPQLITEVTVIRQAGPFALCRIGLITGRTHQIRAHLAYLGHPILGDIKYGNHKMNERTGLKTQALCAQRLTFGRIPEENTLQYLSGRVIKLNDPEIVKTFERLTAEK